MDGRSGGGVAVMLRVVARFVAEAVQLRERQAGREAGVELWRSFEREVTRQIEELREAPATAVPVDELPTMRLPQAS